MVFFDQRILLCYTNEFWYEPQPMLILCTKTLHIDETRGKLSGNHPRFSNYELHLLSLLRFSVRSRGTTKRHYFRVRGDTDQPCVSAANRIARKVAYMLEYHFAKGVFYVLENPMSSLLWRFKCVQRCLERHSAKRDVVHLGCYGANTMKPVPSFKQRCWQA